MKKMTKEQEKFFDLAYSDSVSWGDECEYGMCNGLFAKLGENLEYLSTGVRDGGCEIAVYWCCSTYNADIICTLPINAKGKKALKSIVLHLMSSDIESLELSW